MTQLIHKILLLFICLLIINSCAKDPVIQYELKILAFPTEGGAISPTQGSFKEGESVTITAKPSAEYLFIGWSDGLTGTTNPITLTMNSNKNITATFEKRKYPLSLNIEGDGTVKEEVVQTKSANIDYPSGTFVKLTAVPNKESEFVGWSGDYQGLDNPITITIDKSKTINAKFKKKLFISLSPIYTFPNNTNGELISNYYWPAIQLMGKQISEFMPFIPQGYTFENSGVTFMDIGNDGILDLVGYLPDPEWLSGKTGKFFILLDVFGKKELKVYPSKFSVVPRFEINDYNGDGILDLLAISSNSHQNAQGVSPAQDLPYIFYFFNKDGTFQEIEIGDPWSEHDVATGDIDNDGDIDILNWGSRLPDIKPYPRIFLNNGGGSFVMREDLIKEVDNKYIWSYQSLAQRFFDLDNDGCLDLIAGCQFDKKSVEENNAFPYSIYWGDCSGSYSLYSKRTELPSDLPKEIETLNFLVVGINVIDFDRDGDLDIVTSTTKREYDGYYLQLLENKGNRVFEDVTIKLIDKSFEIGAIKNSVYMFYRTRISDIDGDGDFDIIPIHQHLDNYFLSTYWENINGKFVRRN